MATVIERGDAQDAVGRSTAPVVILRALGLGDFVTGLPALRSLRFAFPGRELVLLAPRALAPLVAISGAADRLVDVSGIDRPPDITESAALKIEPGIVAVNLHGRGPQSHRFMLALRPRTLLAFASDELDAARFGERADDAPTWRSDEHEISRWCRMLRSHGIAADPRDQYLDAEAANASDADRGHTIAIHPGAASGARRWPIERWADVVRAAAQDGFSVKITAGPDDRERAQAVAERAGLPPSTIAPERDLGEFARWLGTIACLISGDTGVAHLATATRTPSVTLFGPTSPAQWGPTIDLDRHSILWNGSTGDPHGEHCDPALRAIAVDEVIEQMRRQSRAAMQRARRTEAVA